MASQNHGGLPKNGKNLKLHVLVRVASQNIAIVSNETLWILWNSCYYFVFLPFSINVKIWSLCLKNMRSWNRKLIAAVMRERDVGLRIIMYL